VAVSPGDLYLEVHLKPHRPVSTGRPLTSRWTLPIAPWEERRAGCNGDSANAGRAVLRCAIIRPNSQSGQKMRLPRSRTSRAGRREIKYIQLKIVVPPANHTGSARPVFEEMKQKLDFNSACGSLEG